jgi:hypothetical protein
MVTDEKATLEAALIARIKVSESRLGYSNWDEMQRTESARETAMREQLIQDGFLTEESFGWLDALALLLVTIMVVSLFLLAAITFFSPSKSGAGGLIGIWCFGAGIYVVVSFAKPFLETLRTLHRNKDIILICEDKAQ